MTLYLALLVLVHFLFGQTSAYPGSLSCSQSLAKDVYYRYMGTCVADTSGRSLSIKKSGSDVTGHSVSYDSSTYTVYISSTNGQYVFELSGPALFAGGWCSGLRAQSNGVAFTVTGPGTVNIWAGFATGRSPVQIMPAVSLIVTAATTTLAPVSLPPTAAPTLHPTQPSFAPTTNPTFTEASPTPAPSSLPTQSPLSPPSRSPTIPPGSVPPTYTVSVTVAFSLASGSIADVRDQQTNVANVIATGAGVSPSNVAIVSVTTGTGTARALLRRLLTGQNVVVVVFSITGFTSSSSAAATSTTAQSFLTSSQFATTLQLNAGLAVSGVTVTSASVGTISASSFANTCALNSHMSLLWTYSSTAGVTGMLTLDSSSNWFSGGIVNTGEMSMVSATNTNKVFLYAPSSNMVGYYAMMSKSASGFEADSASRTNTGISTVQSVPSSSTSSMSFTIAPTTGIKSDVPLATSPGSFNSFIWAHGSVWPVTHAKGNYGFTNVYWTDGRCEKLSSISVSPFFVIILLVIIAACNSPYSPLTPALKSLHTTRPPLPILQEYSLTGYFAIALLAALNILVLLSNSTSTINTTTLRTLASGSGKATIMNFWLAIIPTSKTSLTLSVFGVPFERAVKYHKLVVILGMVLGLVHLCANLAANSAVFYSTEAYGSSKVKPLYGLLSYLTFSAMTLMAVPAIRKFHHEVFRFFHYLYWLGIALVIVHTSGGVFFIGFVPGLLLQMADKCKRIYFQLNPLNPLSVAVKSEAGVVKLTVPSTKACGHGQYFYVNAPSISHFEWHPFSVSGSDGNAVTFHIKSNGGNTWTSRLAALTTSDDVSIDGPFGSTSIDLADKAFRKVLLVAGGIGITPMLHMLESIASRVAYNHIEQVHFVWSCRGAELLEVFREKLEALAFSERVNIDIHLTSGGSGGGSGGGGSKSKMKKVGSYELVGSGVPAAVEMGFINSSAKRSLHVHTDGRPDINNIVTSLKGDQVERRVIDQYIKNAVMICGPAGLADSVERFALQQGLHCHVEVFSL